MTIWHRGYRRRHRIYEETTVAREGLVALGHLQPGQRAIVARLLGGRGLQSRLAALGLTVGAEVMLVQNYGHGPLLLDVRDTRLALGRGEANHILVRPC